MALEFIDGFEGFTNALNFGRKWDTSNAGATIQFPAGRFGGQAWRANTSTAWTLVKTLTAQATRTVRFAFMPLTLTAYPIFAFLDSGSSQCELRLTATGQVTVTRNGTVLATSSITNLILVNIWCFIEFQVTIGTTGSYTLKVTQGSTTTTWLTSGSANTQATANASANQIAMYSNANSGNHTFDDFACANDSTFRGEAKIVTTFPNADDTAATGTNLLWTPNSGSPHFSRLNETNPDDDTSFVSSSTPGQIDTYKFPAIAVTGPIEAVQVTLCERKDDAGARTTAVECRDSGGTNHQGANSFSPGSLYLMDCQVFETDPLTGVAWLQASLNTTEFGPNCVA